MKKCFQDCDQSFIGIHPEMELKCKVSSEMFTADKVYTAVSKTKLKDYKMFTDYIIVDDNKMKQLLNVRMLINNFVIL